MNSILAMAKYFSDRWIWSCVSRGGGAASYKKKFKTLYSLTKKCPGGHKISIIDIYNANTARYLKLWWFLYFINEQFNKNAKVEKLTKKLGEVYALLL